jgi:hypothetical protein
VLSTDVAPKIKATRPWRLAALGLKRKGSTKAHMVCPISARPRRITVGTDESIACPLTSQTCLMAYAMAAVLLRSFVVPISVMATYEVAPMVALNRKQ